MATLPANGYSVENAAQFGWGSITGDLRPERVELLRRYVVGETVLDAGCAGGGFVDYLVRNGFHATGLDKYEMFLNVARLRGLKGRSVRADLATPLPFADASFDTTICFDVLEHVPDDAAALMELARVTKRRLLITVPQEDRWTNRYGLIFSTYRDATHLRYYTPESLKCLSERVHPQRVDIFGEIPIPVRDLARDLIRPQSRYPFLTTVYQRLFAFLLFRNAAPTLFLNLAAAIDVRDPQST
jgi:SAM-dependent methyltransferase